MSEHTRPRPLLLLFRASLGCCRLAEFEAVARRLEPDRVKPWLWKARVSEHFGGDLGPALVQPLPPFSDDDHAWLADAAARSVGCRGAFELWGQGETLEACAEQAKGLSERDLVSRIRGSWRVNSCVLGSKKSLHPRQRTARIETFADTLAHLKERPVDLDQPDDQLWLVENRQRLRAEESLPDPPPRFMLLFQLKPSLPPIRKEINRLDVKKRAFISASTMAADRALALSNLALADCRSPDFTVVDPYCGSGGLLLTSAALGAQTVGSDLDWRLVSANRVPLSIPPTPSRPSRGEERVSMVDNFDEASLPHPKALLSLDVSSPDTPAQLLSANGGQRFDALLCDPPYGRREFQQGSMGWEGAMAYKVDQGALAKTLVQLLELGARILKPGGRLVFMAPTRSERDQLKPSLVELADLLRRHGSERGQELLSIGEDVVHAGLSRATLVVTNGVGKQPSP